VTYDVARVSDEKIWQANKGPQERFLRSAAFEVLYGGAAGGGKSEALLVAALRYTHAESYRAILFRRTFVELERSLIERSWGFYPQLGARYNDQKHFWRFPSGARIWFGHLEHEKNVYDHQSAEYQFIGFDEVTSFTEKQYRYLLSRARSSTGLPIRIRAASNPGGEGHEWVQKRWAPWLDESPDYKGIKAEPGEELAYLNTEAGEIWTPRGTPEAKSRVFIPAKLSDNPMMGPGYRNTLMGLDQVTREQLLNGNWMIRPAAGLYFKRGWFPVVEAPPAAYQRIRYWDRAASPEGDYTVGLLLSRTHDKRLCVEDVVRFRGTPGEVKRTVRATAELDGLGVQIGIEQDPGQAGVFEADWYIGELQGWNVMAYPVSKNKVTRAGPVSAQVQAGYVSMVRGHWNTPFIQELEAFPTEGVKDDQVDALSGAFAALVSNEAPSLPAQPMHVRRSLRG
jgi:predicted phage terminase large subunit-like protein